jgi:hypothetical protein
MTGRGLEEEELRAPLIVGRAADPEAFVVVVFLAAGFLAGLDDVDNHLNTPPSDFFGGFFGGGAMSSSSKRSIMLVFRISLSLGGGPLIDGFGACPLPAGRPDG